MGKEFRQAAKGFQQINVPAASTALTVPKDATGAMIQCEATNVRWRDDGVAPTAGVGFILAAGQTLDYAGNLGNLRFIQTAAGSILNVAYYGETS